MNTTTKPNYKKTLRACYLGFITQAIAANFAPLLFLKLHNDYQIALGLIALIPTAFFFTQLVVDIFCAKFVDRIGYRVSIVASEAFSAVGLIALAFLPEILPSAYAGIMISVVLYAIGSGLIEVLCSPIVEACPFENKEATMSLLHSFYCWGWLGVTLISTLLFTTLGIDNWKYIACFWAIVPLYNIYNFATCPIEKIVEDGKDYVRIFCRNHVAWNFEHFFKKDSNRRNCNVRSFSNGRRLRRFNRAKYSRNDFSESRRQPSVWTFLWGNLPSGSGDFPYHLKIYEKRKINWQFSLSLPFYANQGSPDARNL